MRCSTKSFQITELSIGSNIDTKTTSTNTTQPCVIFDRKRGNDVWTKKRENDCWTIMKRWDSEEKAILPGNFQFSDKANTLCLFLDQPFCSTIVFSETTNIIISSTFALFFRRRIDNKDVSSSSSA